MAKKIIIVRIKRILTLFCIFAFMNWVASNTYTLFFNFEISCRL